MPNFGLSRPRMAKYNEGSNYTDAFLCGKAIQATITPAFNEGSVYADNQEDDKVTEFKNAAVTLNTNTLPKEAAVTCFGHTVAEDGSETSKTDDSPNYVGMTFINQEIVNHVKKYRGLFLPKVLFSEGEESFQTKGDSIVFGTPTISGSALGTDAKNWREKSQYFDTEEAADEWCKQKLNVTEKCATPVASVNGGTYATSQSVTLTTTTSGASIYYTTNGITPTADTGTKYTSAISIEQSTNLKAIATKSGAADSDVLSVEYIIAD